MGINIHLDGLKDIQERLPSEKDARTAAMHAINRATAAGKVAATREVVKLYTVKRAKINERVTTSRASVGNLEASVSWRGRPIGLADFQVNPSKPQPTLRPVLSANVLKSTGLKPVPGAFLANVRSGLRAFERSGSSRLPIEALYGPSVPEMLGNESVVEAIETRANEVLEARLEHEITRMLDKL